MFSSFVSAPQPGNTFNWKWSKGFDVIWFLWEVSYWGKSSSLYNIYFLKFLFLNSLNAVNLFGHMGLWFLFWPRGLKSHCGRVSCHIYCWKWCNIELFTLRMSQIFKELFSLVRNWMQHWGSKSNLYEIFGSEKVVWMGRETKWWWFDHVRRCYTHIIFHFSIVGYLLGKIGLACFSCYFCLQFYNCNSGLVTC